MSSTVFSTGERALEILERHRRVSCFVWPASEGSVRYGGLFASERNARERSRAAREGALYLVTARRREIDRCT